VACLVCGFEATCAGAEELEITASRFGYNLLWPTKRCCAFDFRVVIDGAATLSVKRNGTAEPVTESRSFELTPQGLLNIRRVLEQADFFALPKEICCGPVDGDMQRISVRLGARTHQVLFGEGTSPNQRAELARALSVWRVLKGQFKIDGENVETTNAF